MPNEKNVEVLEAESVEGDAALETLPAEVRREIITTEERFNADTAMAELSYRIEMRKRVMPEVMRSLTPNDFRKMGDTCYLQDIGAQRLKSILGVMHPKDSPPVRERIELEDGNFIIRYAGMIGSRTLRVTDYVIGARSSADKFFDRWDPEGNRLPVDEALVDKAAYTNWEVRGITGMAGLRGLTPEALDSFGFKEASKIPGVHYAKGAKGGGGSSIVPFGNNKGKEWADLQESDLTWFLGRFSEEVNDPSKAKYKDINARRIEAIKQVLRDRSEAP